MAELELISLNITLFDVEALEPEFLVSETEATLLIQTVSVSDAGTRKIERQLVIGDEFGPMELPRLIQLELREILERHYGDG